MIGPGVTGWPFWPKHQPFHCQKGQHGKGSSRIQIFDGREGHKGNVVFQKQRDCMYKDSQGPARQFGNQKKGRNYYCCGMKSIMFETSFHINYYFYLLYENLFHSIPRWPASVLKREKAKRGKKRRGIEAHRVKHPNPSRQLMC